MVDDGEDNGAVGELEFDLKQLRKARSDLAPENLDADGLVDFDRAVATNESRPLSIDKIVNEYLPQPVETIEDGSSDERMRLPKNQYHHHHELMLTRQWKS